jgi:Uma2 family endonuclease
MAVAERRYAWDDIKDWPADVSRRIELFDGRLEMSPTPGSAHGFANTGLAQALLREVARGGGGRLFVAPIDVVLAPDCVFQPDLCFVRQERLSIIERTHIAGPPDLCIEVISESSRGRDERDKFALYARHGVAEYWLVDPAERRIRTFRNDGGRFALLSDAAEGGRAISAVFPALPLDPAEVFASI